MTDIPQWFPQHPAIYDIRKSWLENLQSGPSMHGMPIPQRNYLPKDKWIDFLGFKVASPIGVPAGPLLDSQWTGLAARLGFDVVTYKTIRSTKYDGHAVPNVIFVDPNEVTSSLHTKDELSHPINSINYEPQSVDLMAITNSFGMPSMSMDYLKADIPKANSMLKEGQVMIVSVVGTPTHTNDKSLDYTNFVKDFTEIALFAKNCGASIVEANFSCPNVVSGEGSIYSDVNSVRDISSAITNVLGDTPFMIKVGQYKDEALLTSVLKAAAQSKVRGICGLNSVSMKVVDPTTKLPALGENRLVSGICGAPIRENALHFVKAARKAIDKEQLNLALVGCGGVTTKEHFTEFVDAGATVAMSATGMMWDPYLALRYHNE